MKKWKNRLDEMQEQKLLKTEHNGFWMAFWGLIIVMAVQAFAYGPGEYRYMMGEWIVFMCLAIYMVISCIKNGIWDRHLAPTPAVNIIASVIGGLFCGILQFVVSYRQYHALIGSMAAALFMFIFGFICCCIGVFASAALYKKRVEKLENSEEESEDEPE